MGTPLGNRTAGRSLSTLAACCRIVGFFFVFINQRADALGVSKVCHGRPDLRLLFLRRLATRREAHCQRAFTNSGLRESTCPSSAAHPTCCSSSDCRDGNVCDCFAGCERPVCLFRLHSGARSHLCAPLLPPPNGQISGGTKPYTATFSCKDGYFLQGSPTLTCAKDNKWLRPAKRPRCKSYTCSAPDLPVNVGALYAMRTHYVNGATVRIRCKRGFVFRIGRDPGARLSSTRLLRCRKSGQWSPRKAKCYSKNDVKCFAPALPRDTVVLQGSSHSTYPRGSLLTVGCSDDPKRVHRRTTITCIDSGTWSGWLLPNCSVPTKPRKPRVVKTTSTSITLRWKSPLAGSKSVTAYRLKYLQKTLEGDSTQRLTRVLMRNVRSLTIVRGWYSTTIGRLQADRKYCIIVTAISGKFSGADSRELCATTS